MMGQRVPVVLSIVITDKTLCVHSTRLDAFDGMLRGTLPLITYHYRYTCNNRFIEYDYIVHGVSLYP